MDSKDIEKKNLEAHVELCAVRYKFIEEKLDAVDDQLVKLATAIGDVKTMMQHMAEKRNTQLISWGLGIMAVMVTIIGHLLTTYVIK
jgi:hypothetical protein